jgi:uncharacterized DUF497 family protein
MMNLRIGKFDWDDGNRSRCQEHGVSTAEIEFLFLHGPRVAPDSKHSRDEDRFDCSGENGHGKAAVCGFYDAHKRQLRADLTGERSVSARKGDSSL